MRMSTRSSTTEIFLEPMLRSEDGQMPGVMATTATGQTLTRRILDLALLMGALSPLVDRGVARRRERRIASDALAFQFTATG